jgi:hypothetical protein
VRANLIEVISQLHPEAGGEPEGGGGEPEGGAKALAQGAPPRIARRGSALATMVHDL